MSGFLTWLIRIVEPILSFCWLGTLFNNVWVFNLTNTNSGTNFIILFDWEHYSILSGFLTWLIRIVEPIHLLCTTTYLVHKYIILSGMVIIIKSEYVTVAYCSGQIILRIMRNSVTSSCLSLTITELTKITRLIKP